MLDLGPFSNQSFDPKKWINSATQTRHPQDSLDNHLVDLEMKLQMVSEEIAASLEEQSAAALLRVPRATRDVIRLRDDAVSLRVVASGILQKLKKVIILTLLLYMRRIYHLIHSVLLSLFTGFFVPIVII